MTTPVFSISVPVGAWHPFLPACLESLARQQAPVEIALLDASGDDRVRALGDLYADRLAYRRHGPDKGQSDAIIEGWRETKGDVLGWLNADDILFPDAIARARAAFEARSALDVVYGHSVILDEAGRMTGYHWSVEPPGPRLLESGIVSQPSCFFRRAAYEKAGGLDPSLHYTMDWELWIRLYKSGARFDFIDEPLSLVLWGEDTKTASFNPQRQAELKAIIEAHAPPERRKKIFRSFAIHNRLDRLRPAALKRAAFAALTRRRRTIYGLGADGRLEDGAALWFVHYEPEPKAELLLSLDDPAAVTGAAAGGRDIALTRRGRDLALAFEPPIAAGETLRLALTLAPGAAPAFRAAAWSA